MIMDPMVLAAFLFVPFFFFLARNRRWFMAHEIRSLPSHPGLPFIGNLHQLGALPHRSLSNLSKKYGPLLLLHLGSVPTLIVSSPNMAKEILKTHDVVFASRPLLKSVRVLSYNNLDMAFSPYGECWRQLRKISVTHLFSTKLVQSFSTVRGEEVAQLVERISNHNGSNICITEMLNDLTNNTLCRVVLGSSMNDEKRRLISNMVKKSVFFFSKVFVEDLFPKLGWLDKVLGFEKKLQRHFEEWDKLYDEFIEEHMTKSKDQHDSVNFLDVLLQLHLDSSMEFVLTKEHLKALLMDMLVAGTDTPFFTLDWSMVELIRSPEVMKKAQDEVRANANGEAMVNEEQLQKMTYLKAVVKEVLRIHPPIALLIPRESMEDCQIQGYVIPFGAGRRICPGLSFAVIVVELVLANLLYRFDWSLPSGSTIEDMDMSENPGIISFLNREQVN